MNRDEFPGERSNNDFEELYERLEAIELRLERLERESLPDIPFGTDVESWPPPDRSKSQFSESL